MKILALDTATEACSVALWNDGAIFKDYVVAPQQHAHLLLPMLDKLQGLAKIQFSDLDAIAVGVGPGSFTGVRIAVSTAQAIAFAHQLPVVTVTSLEALAEQACIEHQASKVMVAIDGRMARVYWATYVKNSDDEMQLLGQEQDISPVDLNVEADIKNTIGIGSGWQLEALKDKINLQETNLYADCYPRAQDIAVVANRKLSRHQEINVDTLIPNYIREWGS